jgi:hypothetical protein
MGELNGVMGQITERQRVLTTALDAQRETIGALLDRLTNAQDLTATTAERAVLRLTDGAQTITQSVETIDARVQDALGSVQRATAGFGFETEAIEKKTQTVIHDARQIVASASDMREQIDGLRTSMHQQGEATHAMLGSLLDRVKEGAADLRDVSATTEMSLMNLNSSVTQQSAALNVSMQSIGERQTALIAAIDAQRETIDGLLSRLVRAQEETAVAAERGVSRLVESAQTIAQHTDAIDAKAKKALVNVQAATEAFALEAKAIDTEATRAQKQAQEILTSTKTLHEKINGLRTSMQNEGGQATEALDVLLNRITAGSGELRNAGATAETTLSSLQRALGEKTGELSTSMQQIGERQRTLATALDAQRETIGNLLTRFAQAQEETVVIAERTATRLNEEALSITTSIDMIGAQASVTLGNVQASVSGFAEQAVELKLHSQQAEQQVRSLMSTTGDMQEHAKQLRESMQGETGRVMELLSGVIEKLDAAGRQLKTQTGDAAQSLEQTRERFSSVAQAGADIIVLQTQVLNQAIDQTTGQMAQANDKVHAQIKLANEFGDKAETQAQQLANAAEFATTRLVALRETITSVDKNGNEAVANASARIDEVKAALESQLRYLAEISKTSVEQVAGAAEKLASESGSLRANLASSESALNEAAEFVRAEAQQLPATLTRSVSNLEAATKGLKDASADADKALIGTADRFISVTANARDNMAEEMKRVGSVAEDAGKILTGFNQLLTEQVAAMQQGTTMLSGEQRELIERANTGVATLSEATERLVALRSEASSTAERLVREFGILDQRAAMTGGRLAQAGEGIAKQVEAITEATANAEKRMSGAGNTLRDQLEHIRGGLQGQIDDINRGLTQITSHLERTANSLRSTAVGAVVDVERVGQRFEQTGVAATAGVKAETEKMRKATDEVAGILGGFSEKFDQMIDHMAQAGADIKCQEGSAIDHLQRMLGHLGTVAEKLESARSMSSDVSQNAIERLDEVVTAVQSQMSKMTSNAQTAAGIMRGIGQIYNDQTGSLAKGMNDAHNQVVTMNKDIDDMQQRTDRMRSALKMQGEDLMNSLRQILVQLEMTGDGLTDAVDSALRHQAANGAKKMG